MDSLTLNVAEYANESVVVAVAGEIDMHHSGRLRDALMGSLERGPKLIVDLSGVRGIDSAGIATLLEVAQVAKRERRRMILAGVDKDVHRVLKIARLDQVFEMAPSVEAARKA